MSATVEKVEPWTEVEAKHYQNTARQCFKHDYDHGAKSDPLNCQGCALRETSRTDGPNVAGWARLFVEARMPIPGHWRKAFESELRSKNKRYAEALARSIATFGQPDFV